MESVSNNTRPQRVLIMAHGHPDFSLGGGELAAYNLFKALRDDETVEQAWFIARHDSGNGPTGAFTLRRENDISGSNRWGIHSCSRRRTATPSGTIFASSSARSSPPW